MCGFCGLVVPKDHGKVGQAQIKLMADTIAHRGPDDEGFYIADQVALGHRRLSIVDLAAGHQPMSNEDGTWWIAFNGEIYNHAELRTDLEGRGHRYRTRSDTETIIHLTESFGEDAPKQLRGMFAFAVWNEADRSLLLARDHSGIKPLYYASLKDGTLVFASEVKAIFASGLLSPEIKEEVVEEYLATGHVSGELTLFEGVRKLPPGCTLRWQNGSYAVRRFWSIADQAASDERASSHAEFEPDRVAADFWHRFTDSVRSQLMADVPLGVFLSGGLDSSILVAAMRDAGVEGVKSFSVGYQESESELPWARQVAKHLGTVHHEVIVKGEDFFSGLDELSWHRDFPLTFSASIPLYHVAKLAGEHVKVVLTGEGSDELFGGYGRYPRALINLRWAMRLDSALPGTLRDAVASMARAGGTGYLGSRLARSFVANHGSVQECYLEAFADYSIEARDGMLSRDIPRGRPFGDVASLVDAALAREHPLEALLRYDQATYLEELLMKQDTMSMAVSIESRVPFLDHLLVEWAARLPAHVKLQGMTGKALVRRAAAKHLPADIANGEKRGFPVPLGGWLRTIGRGLLEDALPSQGDAVLDARYARSMFDEHMRGVDHTARLWRLLALQVWRQRVIPRLQQLSASAAAHTSG